jgi:hypothetical protein
MSNLNRIVFGVVIPVSVFVVHTPARAISFTKIADRYTTVPDKITRFKYFDNLRIDGTNVLFNGIDLLGGHGLYLYDGRSIEKVVDDRTLVPEGFGAYFKTFPDVAIDGSNVAFSSGGPIGGVYAKIGEGIELIADEYTRVPDGSRDFAAIGLQVSIDGTDVAFTAQAFPNLDGIFARVGGVMTKIVDTNDAVPGGTHNFGHLQEMILNSGRVAFVGSEKVTLNYGIYFGDGKALTVVADGNTPPSSVSPTRWYFALNTFDDGVVTFQKPFEGDRAPTDVYQNTDGTQSLIFDASTPLADGSGSLSDIWSVSFDSGSIAMTGTDASGKSGIFLYRDAVLQRLIGENDTLDGRCCGLKFLIGIVP